MPGGGNKGLQKMECVKDGQIEWMGLERRGYA